MGQPVTITPDQPSSGAVTITPDQPSPRGFLSNLWSDVKGAFPPRAQNPYPGMGVEDKQAAVAQSGAEDQSRKEAGYSLPYRIAAPVAESVGVNVPGMEESARQGDVGGVLGHAAAVPATYGALRGAGEVAPRIPAGKIAQSMGKAATAVGEAIDPDWIGLASPRAAHALRLSSKVGRVASKFGRGSIAESMKDAGAPFPEAPAPEVTQAAALQRGPQVAQDPAAGLGRIPVRGSIAESMAAPTNAAPQPTPRGSIAEQMKTPETTPAAQQSAAPPPAPRPITRGSINKMMGTQLDNALGAKQLDPKVPLRGQIAAKMPVAAEESELPPGHKAVDSSALRSYNYDAPAKEFHARATSGSTIYVYGDVSPEAAAGFEGAPSKGKAWQSIRQNHPLVAKIVDGKRIAVKPSE